MKPSPEIEAIVRRFVASRVDGAAGTGRSSANLLSRSEHFVLVGSDESDWYEGAEVVPIVVAGNQALPVADIEIRRLRAFEEGRVGWAVWDESRTYKGGPTTLVRRVVVLELEDDSWKIVLSHFSVPVPRLQVFGADLTQAVSGILESIRAGDEALEGISGTATFVFTDIVDSTPLSLQLGEQAWHRAITSHFDSVREIVENERGSVVKTLGDGGMFAFESGSAALRAAISMQQVVSASSDPDLMMRVGVHTGDVVQTEDDYVGATVAKAARVAATASGGQILVSATTAGLVNSSEFEFGKPFLVELKGLDGVHHLQLLHWS